MKKRTRDVGILRPIICGVGMGVFLAIIFAMIFAKLCEKGIIAEKRILLTALISLFLAVFLSTFYTGSRVQKQRFVCALCVGGIELILVILLHTLLLQGAFYHILWIGALLVIATGIGGMLGSKKKRKRKFA